MSLSKRIGVRCAAVLVLVSLFVFSAVPALASGPSLGCTDHGSPSVYLNYVVCGGFDGSTVVSKTYVDSYAVTPSKYSYCLLSTD